VKVLFVCVANINRSQIAEAIFNNLSKSNRAVSAGLKPNRVGVLVRMEHNNPVSMMKEMGYDMSKARVKGLTRKETESAGRIVLIFDRKHLEEVPAYLRNRTNVERWEVSGISDDTPAEEYHRLEKRRIGKIEALVNDLAGRLG